MKFVEIVSKIAKIATYYNSSYPKLCFFRCEA